MEMDFTSVLMSVDDQVIARLVSEMDTQGFAVLENFLSPDQLQQARAYILEEAQRHDGEYFSIHGIEAMAGSVLGSLGSSPLFRQFLADLCEAGTGKAPPATERIFPVIRCVQGRSGLKESHFYHFDASLLTALAPTLIPTEGDHCGDLISFPNIRPQRSTLVNIIEKAILHNTLSQKLTAFGVRRGLLKPVTLKLVPGNLYLFWGYRSLHANDECDLGKLRATAIYHFFNPHRESVLARHVLGSNKRRARLNHEGLRTDSDPASPTR